MTTPKVHIVKSMVHMISTKNKNIVPIELGRILRIKEFAVWYNPRVLFFQMDIENNFSILHMGEKINRSSKYKYQVFI